MQANCYNGPKDGQSNLYRQPRALKYDNLVTDNGGLIVPITSTYIVGHEGGEGGGRGGRGGRPSREDFRCARRAPGQVRQEESGK